jgi:polyhydroxybutyrate depolymerase
MTTDITLEVGGRSRTAIVVGEPRGPRPRPLVLVLHGSKQDAAAHRRFTGGDLDRLATEHDAVVAYLDGYRGNWNDAREESWFPARRDGVDDVAFVRAVVDRLAVTHDVDRSRVIAVGYSNGGQMVFRLAHEAPGLIAGGVAIAATMPRPGSFALRDRSPGPMPMVLVHGTEDPIAPYGGGAMAWWKQRIFKVGGENLPAPETAAYFARHNGIGAAPVTEPLAPEAGSAARTRIERTAYAEAGRPPVTLYTVLGGGHTIPGPKKAPFFLGRTARDVAAADLIADAFDL